MSRDGWQSAKELFGLALDQPAGEREAFVEKACGDAAVRAEVLRLLRLHDASSDFLVSPMSVAAGATEGAVDPLIGRSLGGFVIVRRIGVGGMGAVYEAEQGQPRRRAAVKVLRPGVFAPRMQRRFEYESEVLAKLQHPGIAQVFAAGTFEIGGAAAPWFAMELIDGPSIQTYVKTGSPGVDRKVAMLLAVCDAVQHAHERGIIHRDLKPDNILITETSAGTPQPKVLDFGVARSIDADVQTTMQTVAGEIVGTLAYMSPEQLSGDPERIDARSDVFALGVIGYELLGGRLPHGAGRSSFAEVIRAIEQEEPPPLGACDAALCGDLEVIIAKALEKDVSRRYQSAAALAADLRHFMNNEPVSARPATAVYRFRKFARRNRALVGGVTATMLALAAGMILYAREARIAQREAEKSRYEADKATAINNFIVNDFLMKLLTAANVPEGGKRLPVAALVEKASEQTGPMFASDPLGEAAVRNEIGSIYYNLGTLDQSGEQFQRALDLWEAKLGPDHPDTLKAVNNLGQVRARQHRSADAEALYRRALEGRRRVLGPDDSYTLVTMNNLAELYRRSKRLDEAETLLRQALESQKRVHGINHKHTITTFNNLAGLLMQRDNYEEAAELHRQAHEASRATLGSDHVLTAVTGVRLGLCLQRVGRAAEAGPLLLEVATSVERTQGASHPEAINARRVLGRGYRQQKKYAEAAEQFRLALAGAEGQPDGGAAVAGKIRQELAEVEGRLGGKP